jgi:long-chain acyl-CoA synthetase
MKRKETEAKLSGLEKVRRIHLHAEMFSVANELLTPTFKVKRNVAKKVFDKEIKQMYAEENA